MNTQTIKHFRIPRKLKKKVKQSHDNWMHPLKKGVLMKSEGVYWFNWHKTL